MKDNERRILLGRVVGGFGLRGEIKIESWTEPRMRSSVTSRGYYVLLRVPSPC